MNTKGVEDGMGDAPKFDDNHSEAAAFAGITFSQACQFDMYMEYLLGRGPAPGFLAMKECVESPESMSTGDAADKSEGIKMGAFTVADPSPFPVDEKFTIYLDEEGDYMIQSQRESGLQAHGSTLEDALYAMRQVLDMAASLESKPAHPTAPVESPAPAMKDEVESPEQPSTSTGISKIFGTWPGDETDEQLLTALEEVRKPSMSTGDAADRPEKPEMYVFYELKEGRHAIPWEVYKVEDVERLKWLATPSLSPEMEQLVALLKKSKQLASIGYRIGEADMRGHDKIGERYGKQQDELIAEIDTFLDHIEGKAK